MTLPRNQLGSRTKATHRRALALIVLLTFSLGSVPTTSAAKLAYAEDWESDLLGESIVEMPMDSIITDAGPSQRRLSKRQYRQQSKRGLGINRGANRPEPQPPVIGSVSAGSITAGTTAVSKGMGTRSPSLAASSKAPTMPECVEYTEGDSSKGKGKGGMMNMQKRRTMRTKAPVR